MDTSRLTERIEILQPSSSKQSNGEVITEDALYDTVWSDAFPLGGSEKYSGQKNTPVKKFRFVIRHRTDIDESFKIRWGGKKWDIDVIQPIFKKGRNNYLELRTNYVEGRE